MATDAHNDEVTKKDLRHSFDGIREDIEKAASREGLDELYKRAAYMILMTHSTPLEDKTDREMKIRREITERDFARTVRMINRQAKKSAQRQITMRDGRNYPPMATKQIATACLNQKMQLNS